tara:strand:+ start:967 stop:1119 length:153 start_codon:yes stop_codon:yes gene_type:complete
VSQKQQAVETLALSLNQESIARGEGSHLVMYTMLARILVELESKCLNPAA